MKTYFCPNCGERIQVIFSDPRAKELEEEMRCEVRGIESFSQEDQRRIRSGEWRGTECPYCHSLIQHGSYPPTISDRLDIDELDYDFIPAQPEE